MGLRGPSGRRPPPNRAPGPCKSSPGGPGSAGLSLGPRPNPRRSHEPRGCHGPRSRSSLGPRVRAGVGQPWRQGPVGPGSSRPPPPPPPAGARRLKVLSQDRTNLEGGRRCPDHQEPLLGWFLGAELQQRWTAQVDGGPSVWGPPRSVDGSTPTDGLVGRPRTAGQMLVNPALEAPGSRETWPLYLSAGGCRPEPAGIVFLASPSAS